MDWMPDPDSEDWNLVVHYKKKPFDVYIGRPSVWGNPFEIGKDGSRIEVIEKYYKYITENPGLLERLSELKGKILGCWCREAICHGDVLVYLLNNEKISS